MSRRARGQGAAPHARRAGAAPRARPAPAHAPSRDPLLAAALADLASIAAGQPVHESPLITQLRACPDASATGPLMLALCRTSRATHGATPAATLPPPALALRPPMW